MKKERSPADSVVLETPRLRLRHLTLDDADFILALLNEPGFIRHVADRGLRRTSDAASYLAEKMLPSYEKNGFGFYRVELKESQIPIGICGLAKRDTLEDPDVGFAILRQFEGQGYAYEAALGTMNYGRETLGLTKIIGITAAGNSASIHLLEKLGLRYQRSVRLPGFERDSLIYA